MNVCKFRPCNGNEKTCVNNTGLLTIICSIQQQCALTRNHWTSGGSRIWQERDWGKRFWGTPSEDWGSPQQGTSAELLTGITWTKHPWSWNLFAHFNAKKAKVRFKQNFTCLQCVQGAAKSEPLKFFAVFSATVWNFNLKFHLFI